MTVGAPSGPRDPRVRVAARALRQATGGACGDSANDSRSGVSSEEEWAASASETSSTTSTRTSQSKQVRSEGLAHPRSAGGEAGEGHDVEVLAPSRKERMYVLGGLGDVSGRINGCVQVQDTSVPTFVWRVTTARLAHNHSLNKHSFDQYAHNRTALEPEVVSTVNEIRKAGANKKNILRLKKQEDSGSTSAKRLKQWMVEFSEEPGMSSIDATHGTNSSKYKVFSIMTNDIFGKGQFVQHAVVQNERRTTLLTGLEEFKRNNPAWRWIHCILIDKDFTEISVLKVAFPDARLLLCQFHVIKYLREEISCSDYGFSSWQKQQLQGILNMLVYARTEREFKEYHGYLNHIMNICRSAESVVSQLRSDDSLLGTGVTELGLGSGQLIPIRSELGAGRDELGVQDNCEVPKHPFDVYFAKNWDSCRPMWCAFERENAVTMGNNTNNRIEASWKQLKDLVNSFIGVDECVVSIMCYQD
ncbi:unnamed protein product [Phytophthora fragariaefolia]|uniref:Unnamed protein product n=1 Tax=Phytophthora fragariaefolia TaxID=1490495 RepID=A0A9W7D2D9_9STRA|nr:unnamed protein product [Phytophthora fragariaefolia]